MDASSESEYVTALAPDSEQATTSSSVFVSALEEQIERSKCHWSELADPDSISIEEEAEEAAAKIDNQKAFKTLQMHPTWGNFFRTFGYDFGIYESSGELVVGEKFAEGGQAELFLVRVKWRDPKNNAFDVQKGVEHVLKVFKKRTLVRHLQEQWPHGMLQRHADRVKLTELGKPAGRRYRSDICCATLLEDGRFAFLMVREHEDLRSRINRKMKERSHDHGCGPFQKEHAEDLMYTVALGLFLLHRFNIVHRDMKASNVLFRNGENGWSCCVADYECSVGVIGTGFWRAPEILQACKEKNATKRPELFSRKADAYSYGMTCYEILTGKRPFEGESVTMDLVIGGQRPKVPEFVDDWARELLDWCWQSDPVRRPSFEEIMSLLEANSSSQYIKREGIERMSRAHREGMPAIKVHSRCD